MGNMVKLCVFFKLPIHLLSVAKENIRVIDFHFSVGFYVRTFISYFLGVVDGVGWRHVNPKEVQ